MRLLPWLAAASLFVACSPVPAEEALGQAQGAATCQRNCPEPPDELPPKATHSVRYARSAGKSAGLHLYRRASATPNYIDVHAQAQGKIATLVVEAAQAGDASTTRRYTLHHGGRALTLERQPNVVRLIAGWKTASERAVAFRWVPRDRRFYPAGGDAALPHEYLPQLGVLAAAVEDIGEADLQAIVDRQGPAPMLTEDEASSAPQVGCYDKGGFCSTEYQVCVRCTGSGGGTDTGTGGGGGVGGGGAGGPTCNGDESIGIGISLLASIGQFRARQDLDAECNKYNQGCSDGCCAFLQTDGKWGPTPEVSCDCVVGSIICNCYLFGKSCGERPLPEHPMDEIEYP